MEDERRRALITQVMCNLRLDYDAVARDLGIDLRRDYAAELAALAPLEADGIVVRDDRGVEVTEVGRPLVRHVAARFDAYLAGATAEQRFSRAI